jgi:hypothetical protein
VALERLCGLFDKIDKQQVGLHRLHPAIYRLQIISFHNKVDIRVSYDAVWFRGERTELQETTEGEQKKGKEIVEERKKELGWNKDKRRKQNT